MAASRSAMHSNLAGVHYRCQQTKHATDEELHISRGMPEQAEGDGLRLPRESVISQRLATKLSLVTGIPSDDAGATSVNKHRDTLASDLPFAKPCKDHRGHDQNVQE